MEKECREYAKRGAVVLPMDATEKDVMQAREKAGVPFEAYCVACKIVEA